MTFYVGDDATQTYPIIDTNGGSLEVGTEVIARRWLGEESSVTAQWAGTATAHSTIQGATIRLLDVPLSGLSAGLWTLRLAVPGSSDLPLGKVVIQ